MVDAQESNPRPLGCEAGKSSIQLRYYSSIAEPFPAILVFSEHGRITKTGMNTLHNGHPNKTLDPSGNFPAY